MELKSNYVTHTLLFPYADILFGKVAPIKGEATFEVIEGEEGSLNIISLTGTSESGKVYDLSYLLDPDSERFFEVIDGILGNITRWDLNEVWW